MSTGSFRVSSSASIPACKQTKGVRAFRNCSCFQALIKAQYARLTVPAGDGAGKPPCYWSSVRAGLQEKMSEEHSSAETNELARMRALVAEYETKMTDAAALIASVRHEINNPLTGLLGQAQLLLREELSDKARGRVQIIEELAKRIEKIVSELRDIQTPVAAVNRAEE